MSANNRVNIFYIILDFVIISSAQLGYKFRPFHEILISLTLYFACISVSEKLFLQKLQKSLKKNWKKKILNVIPFSSK